MDIVDVPKPGIHDAQLALNDEEVRQRLMNDPTFLPTRRQALRILRHPSSLDNIDDINIQRGRGEVHEIFTQEYIDAFANYLITQAEQSKATLNDPYTVLEVAAGMGKLTYFLTQRLNNIRPGLIRIISSDKKVDLKNNPFNVEELDCKTALEKYPQAKLAICSWMPPGIDFSHFFRKQPNIDGYILIGTTDSSVCGEAWETWGDRDEKIAQELTGEESVQESRDIKNKWNTVPAPYEQDGFVREEVENLTQLQIAYPIDPRQDSASKSWGWHHPATVLFRRAS